MTEIVPIYSGARGNFHWVGFGSGHGTNLVKCANIVPPAAIFTDNRDAKLLQLSELSEVEKIVLNGFEVCGSWKAAQGNDKTEREYHERLAHFNELILEQLKRLEEKQQAAIDLIILGGYMRIVLNPLLSAYKDKIINVHPANLAVLLTNKRDLIGSNAVYEALRKGERYTRSSVIIVDEKMDHGEILVQGPEVESRKVFRELSPQDKANALLTYVPAHQEAQKVLSDHPALTTALDMIADGRIALSTTKTFNDEWRTVYVDNKPMPYEGFEVKK